MDSKLRERGGSVACDCWKKYNAMLNIINDPCPYEEMLCSECGIADYGKECIQIQLAYEARTILHHTTSHPDIDKRASKQFRDWSQFYTWMEDNLLEDLEWLADPIKCSQITQMIAADILVMMRDYDG